MHKQVLVGRDQTSIAAQMQIDGYYAIRLHLERDKDTNSMALRLPSCDHEKEDFAGKSKVAETLRGAGSDGGTIWTRSRPQLHQSNEGLSRSWIKLMHKHLRCDAGLIAAG